MATPNGSSSAASTAEFVPRPRATARHRVGGQHRLQTFAQGRHRCDPGFDDVPLGVEQGEAGLFAARVDPEHRAGRVHDPGCWVRTMMIGMPPICG